MNYYISDLHFGHENSIAFDNRPFKSVEGMDSVLINLWNDKVKSTDNVYIVGDFAYQNNHPIEWYLEKLEGHKYLVLDNHDKNIMDNQSILNYFEDVDKMMHVAYSGKHISLCHYPIADWYGSHRETRLIYGHIHGVRDDLYEFMKTKSHVLNTSACINNYMLANFSEIVVNNLAFQNNSITRCASINLK